MKGRVNHAQFLRRLQTARVALLAAVLGLGLVGCGKPPQHQTVQPANVTVSQPVQRQVIQWDQYSGYLSSPQISNVEARVSGLIIEAPFVEGAMVHQGQELYKIDPRPFQADLDSKSADLNKARSQQDLTQATLKRLAKVRGTKAISEEDYDTAVANLEQAKASVASAQAALETSRLTLQWTTVTAPISGRISRKNVTAGNLVNGGSGQATLLTTIVSIDPIYCYINIPESAALRYQKLALQEKHSNVANAHIPCFLELQGENLFTHDGTIDFVDNQVDVGTGTVQVRGVFANPTGLLTPGLYALMRVPASGRYEALLIPDAAVNTDQNERYLLVVGKDDVVSRRPAQLGALFGTLRAITGGLKPDEWVVVNGVQFARPGSKVNPHEAPVSTQALDELEQTATGSPTTQALPVMAPEAQSQSAPASPPASQPALSPTTQPSAGRLGEATP